MSTIYLDEQGSEVKKKGELLIIEKDDKTIAEIPLAQLDRMVIIGNIQITTPALALLLDNEIPVSFMKRGEKNFIITMKRGLLQRFSIVE